MTTIDQLKTNLEEDAKTTKRLLLGELLLRARHDHQDSPWLVKELDQLLTEHGVTYREGTPWKHYKELL